MGNILTPTEELQRLSDNSTRSIESAINNLITANFSNDQEKIRRAINTLADVLRQSQILSDLLGRKRAFMELDALKGTVKFSNNLIDRILYASTPTVPNVPFQEAINDLLSREPRLATSAGLVSKVYSEEHGFALARSMNEKLTRRTRDLIAKSLREGKTITEASELISKLGDFTESYSEVVYRTNLSTAYSAGRFQQAADPDIADIMPAFEYSAIDDAVVRRGRKEDQGENHFALHGLIASTDWQGWQIFAPPNGYACRCMIRLVSVFELKRRKIIKEPGDSVPAPKRSLSQDWVHPNFRNGRPDFQLYFGVTRS